MKVKNHTKIKTEELRKIVRFVQPSNVSNFSITFGNSSNGLSGRAVLGRMPHVHISVPQWVASGKPLDKPYWSYAAKGKGYISFPAYSATEALVGIVAHELRHLWQGKVKRGWRVWGARGQFSERDCDAYAIRKLREWRRLG